ncbi:coproporphyrinogen III oxidase family protein [Ectothiorhodospira haloalkaliphila]|uniref:coproporphyrinogen-III oxidase family protein n=1 Tax=Ectothiorhodospira haloalkaliphila TaxID=421628 RepID=UPI001EE83951|nr:coproporphyrinogen-III oxidase family protein [Ectothiorhodospira haloalkaliphila]MCG5525388.1 coproporphyrinogen III oxidase family protein [Ectothiorhodospira haloalkaliphila]
MIAHPTRSPQATSHGHGTPEGRPPLHYEKRLRSHHDALAPLHGLSDGAVTLGEHLDGREADARPRAIYVHIPFCRKLCHFCNMRRMKGAPDDTYTERLLRDMEALTRLPYVADGRYGAIYFGGGTPSTLSAAALERILAGLKQHFQLTDDVEITLESSVTELTEEKLQACMNAGVNRVSLGVQTFHDAGRRLLGRSGNGQWIAERIRRYRALGLDNLGMDLIYHYPEQTPEDLAADLHRIAELDLAGFSFYTLMVSDKSRLAHQHPEWTTQTAESLRREWGLFRQIMEHAHDQGFQLLELTKLARPGRDRYRYVDLRYQGGDTLPLGAGAGGRLGGMMLMNPLAPEAYEQAVNHPGERQGLATRDPYPAFYRFIGGIQFGQVDLSLLPAPCRSPVAAVCAERRAQGLLTPVDAERLILTIEGVFWGNNLAAELTTTAMNAWQRGTDQAD